jgi:glutaredoxin 3
MSNNPTTKQSSTIKMYSKGYCPYCVRAKQLFVHKGVEFEEIMVDRDQSKLQEMLARSNGARTVPQIFINEHHVGGCDELYTLHRQQKLDKLLFPELVEA